MLNLALYLMYYHGIETHHKIRLKLWQNILLMVQTFAV